MILYCWTILTGAADVVPEAMGVAKDLKRAEGAAEPSYRTCAEEVAMLSPGVENVVMHASGHESDFREQVDDGSWVFQWPSKQPSGSVDDLQTVVGKIAEVLRSVAGEA